LCGYRRHGGAASAETAGWPGTCERGHELIRQGWPRIAAAGSNCYPCSDDRISVRRAHHGSFNRALRLLLLLRKNQASNRTQK
jgi:hypothetical protein